MFELSQDTKENISFCVGMPFEEIYNRNYEAEYPNNQKIIFSKKQGFEKVCQRKSPVGKRQNQNH